MLSLPLINHAAFLTPLYRPNPSDNDTSNAPQQQPHQQAHHRRTHPNRATHRSPLALLAADEAAIEQRKQNIRRFGAGWIRPPGVAKTLQAETEERAEREEQEALARREQQMADMAAMAEVEDLRRRREEDASAGEGERDLDEEIPDADAEDAEVTFNEESLLEGSVMVPGHAGLDSEPDVDISRYFDMEEAELTGLVEAQAELGVERDLDEDVPEAGGYEHTDTDIEDSSSLLEDAGRASARRSMWQGMQGAANGQGRSLRGEGSSALGGSMLESSFVGSSPITGSRARVGQQRGQLGPRYGRE
ncbi:hypothetical protein LTR50_004139 [Elasticomyces elasticus]|nr:hypothetical protein LTR50_004139 [Elasticomyces elasticus]